MEVSLHITDIGTSGDGIARLDSGEVVFVPYAAKGDIVIADVMEDHDGIQRGKIKSVMLSSPDRVKPPCRHFGICGGCSLQHVREDVYKNFKQTSVLMPIQKAGIKLPETIETIYIPPYTRRRANFAARITKGKAYIGFHERRSSNIREVPDCLLLHPSLKEMMEKIKIFLPRLVDEGKKIDVLIQQVGGRFEIGLTGSLKRESYELHEAIAECVQSLQLAQLSLRARDFDAYAPLLEIDPLMKKYGDQAIKLAPGTFLQPSEEGEKALVDLVMENIQDERRVADLFCGNGTFTGPLLEGGREVIAADYAPDAIAAMNASGVEASVRNLFKEPLTGKELTDVDAVILDPPRAGAIAQANILAATNIPKIIYVSCNPTTFAKDAASLQKGGYVLQKLTIVDQFIWSPHTELVAYFKK